MDEMTCTMVVRRSGEIEPTPTKRKGVRERRLLSREECDYQNIVLIDIDEGAEIELHPYPTSESFFVLAGKIELLLAASSTMLGEGDLAHLPPGEVHGFRCVSGPGKFLVVFAPPSGAKPGTIARSV